MDLSDLKAPRKNRSRRRLGRGESSGVGKTCGKGHKGQKARAGNPISAGFEGGQMPLQRRLPKRGFTNIFKICYNIVHIKELSLFEAGTVVTPELLRERGVVKRQGPVKLLSDGDVNAQFTVKLDKISAAAKSKIEAAGGTVVE